MRLLVVEDERALCETIVRSLRRLAYSVDYCCDGEKAQELLGVGDRKTARVVELDAVFPPAEKRHAEVCLQVLHGPGDGGGWRGGIPPPHGSASPAPRRRPAA